MASKLLNRGGKSGNGFSSPTATTKAASLSRPRPGMRSRWQRSTARKGLASLGSAERSTTILLSKTLMLLGHVAASPAPKLQVTVPPSAIGGVAAANRLSSK